MRQHIIKGGPDFFSGQEVPLTARDWGNPSRGWLWFGFRVEMRKPKGPLFAILKGASWCSPYAPLFKSRHMAPALWDTASSLHGFRIQRRGEG